MKLEEKLQKLRKARGYSQEQLADLLGIARQTVSKWETGQAVPELSGLIALSSLYGVSIDGMVKEDDVCSRAFDSLENQDTDFRALVPFLLRAKRETYAGKGRETASSRTASHDYCYREPFGQGEADSLTYYDTYVGGERFSGEEAVWRKSVPVWAMNYTGRVLGGHFSGDFLKEALLHGTEAFPYRGPEIYVKGDYHYHCMTEGMPGWFWGYEEIYYQEEKIYECRFHGGAVS